MAKLTVFSCHFILLDKFAQRFAECISLFLVDWIDASAFLSILLCSNVKKAN